MELDRDIIAKLEDIQPDRVLNALHGQIGEDGSIQGMLNILNIPYTHSGVLSATAMDKISSRLIFASLGIAVPSLLQLEQNSHVYPADYTGAHVIKPRNDGSSFGVVIVKETDSAPERSLWPATTDLMAEVYIPGKELTVSVLDGRVWRVTEIIDDHFYDFDAKYKPVDRAIFCACRYSRTYHHMLWWNRTRFSIC